MSNHAAAHSPEPDLGYNFYSPEVPDHPGHPRLDVCLTKAPTHEHFDPQHVSYPVAINQNDIQELEVHHPWSPCKRYRVCAGRITLEDRHGKAVEAFSFGGDLEITCTEQWTLCALTSPAPIFPLFHPLDLAMWLTAEFEILLAQQRAHWDPKHPHSFEEHLAHADPLRLYACSLQTLQSKANQIHCGSETLDQAGRHFLREEISRLKADGRWPPDVCPVEWLFTEPTGSRKR